MECDHIGERIRRFLFFKDDCATAEVHEQEGEKTGFLPQEYMIRLRIFFDHDHELVYTYCGPNGTDEGFAYANLKRWFL